MTHSNDMRQRAHEKLKLAQDADDILDALWEGAWAKSGRAPEQLPPRPPINPNFIEFLVTTRIKNLDKLPFEESPEYAIFNTTIDNELKHFAYEAYRRLGKCFDALNFTFALKPIELIQVKGGVISSFIAPPKTFTIYHTNTQISLIDHTVESENRRADVENFAHPRASMGQLLLDDISAETKAEFQKFLQIAQNAIETIHHLWQFCHEDTDSVLQHPLAPIVQAYIAEMTAKHIDKEYDRKLPTTVLKYPLGSIRTLEFTETGAAQLIKFAEPDSVKDVGDSNQREFGFMDSAPKSILPNVMPLDVAHPLGVKHKTKAGAVPHVVRIFFEAVMALEPHETHSQIVFTLGELINYLYPDGKFNRTYQLPYILNAIQILSFYATVPFRQDSGLEGRWRPVMARNILHPNSKNDDRVFMEVTLPPDARQGMMVEKSLVRMLGKASAPKFSAYLSACGVWDQYGTTDGKMIDPTKPVESRDTEGYLVDENGKPLLDPTGKRIKNPYSKDAVWQLPREPNPARTQYPVLSNHDQVKACNPTGKFPKHRVALQRAKNYWSQLADANIVAIETLREGWRIMPSVSHLNAYRTLRKRPKNESEKS